MNRKNRKNKLRAAPTDKNTKLINSFLLHLEIERSLSDNTIGLRDKTILEVMYACGLRVSEVLGLKTSNILINEEVIRVFGKGSKERVVPIGKSALLWIDTYLKKARLNIANSNSEDYLFL